MDWPNQDDWIPFEANLEGAVFSGRRFDWRTGFYVRTIEGLLDGGRVSVDAVPRTGGPGGLFIPGKREDERGILISGFAYGRTQADLATLADQFGGLLSDEKKFAPLSFRELGSWRDTLVGRSGLSRFGRAGQNRIAPYQLVVRAPDQRIYGDALETSGWGTSVTVVNRGTYAAPIVASVRGSSTTGYTITGPTGIAVITRALASANPHSYDGDEGVLSVAGVAQKVGVSRSDRLECPPGAHTFSVSNSAQVLISGRHTYNP